MVCDPVSWLAWFSPQGIVRAIKDFQGPLKEHEVTIFVRRGGPNYQEGLRVMGEVGEWDEAKVHREEHKVSQNKGIRLWLCYVICYFGNLWCQAIFVLCIGQQWPERGIIFLSACIGDMRAWMPVKVVGFFFCKLNWCLSCFTLNSFTFSLGKTTGIPIHVFGTETHMTAIVGMALGHRPIPNQPPMDAHTANFLLNASNSAVVFSFSNTLQMLFCTTFLC